MTLDDFCATTPGRILVSVAYCMKGSSCPHRQSDECDSGCAGCELAQLKQVCLNKTITFRIETSNDKLMEFLDREAFRFDWIVGVACPFEIIRLSPPLWEKHRLRQLIFPLVNAFCPARADQAPAGNQDIESKVSTQISRILELLSLL